VPHETTLYDRWQAVVRDRRNDLALVADVPGRRWTFAALAAEAERLPATPEPVVFPEGTEVRFLLAVLQGWRDGRIVCPLEPGQTPPAGPWPDAPVCHLKTTSATSGEPRLIAFTATQLAADAANLVATMGLRPDWPNLGMISLAHSYGFSSLVTPLLLHGIPLVLGGSALPEAVRRAAAALPAVTLPAVPALWRAWHEAGTIPGNVRLAISAGAPLPVALERAVFDATGLKLHNFYGASECGGIAYDRSDTPRTDGALAGEPVANVSVALQADGCLAVSGPAVARGGWPRPVPSLAGGVYRTSDLAALRDGRVYLLGRAGDVINVAGRKVAPETIERALLEHPGVREAVVLGLPAEDGRGEVIAAVVVTAPAPAVAVAEDGLRQFLLERLPAWQVPRRWRLEGAGLTNARGKVSRAALRQTWPACGNRS
jgi:acyl-coenzyme A synthetase/AMP-(fatty) acid ligase